MDQELRLQLLRAAVKDRQFLHAAGRDLEAAYFRDPAEALICGCALDFWNKYAEPVSGLIRTEVEDAARKAKFGAERKAALKELVNQVLGAKLQPVSVHALQDRVKHLKTVTFYESAVEEIVTEYEKGKLNVETLSALVERANRELQRTGVTAHDYLEEAEQRVERRAMAAQIKYPLLFIPELDERIKGLGRGQLGLWLGSYNAGKGLALCHLTMAYAMQGWRVLHLTLEDPVDEVMNRMDAAMTGIPINKLARLPNRFLKRFGRMRDRVHGNVRVVDGTDGGWTVTEVEKLWWTLKQQGFIADVIVVDYDDEIECEKQYKGESARRMEFAEIYRQLRRIAAKLDVILWTAAQARRDIEGKKIVTGKDAAEDISKIRKAFLGIGIGSYPDNPKKKHLYVMRHRLDRSRFGVDIMSDFDAGIFYDAEATHVMKQVASRKKELQES